MSLFHAILLGAIQGVTEFLPVSSSGHLVLLQHLLKFEGPDVLFDTFLHVGTLVAVCIVFREDIINILKSLYNRDLRSPSTGLFILIVWGTIPTVFIGFGFRDVFERLFSEVVPAALMLLVTGSLLFAADRVWAKDSPPKQIGKRDAFLVGIVQGLSVLPGLSRSGATICTGIFLGVERATAARFSFLLSIPAIAGAGMLQLPEVFKLQDNIVLPLIVGMIISTLTGYISIRVLMRLVATRRLSFFSYYCWSVGIGVLLVSLVNILG